MKNFNKAELNGMKMLLEKIVWKIPRITFEYILAEVNDLVSNEGTGGAFEWDEEKEIITYKKYT